MHDLCKKFVGITKEGGGGEGKNKGIVKPREEEALPESGAGRRKRSLWAQNSLNGLVDQEVGGWNKSKEGRRQAAVRRMVRGGGGKAESDRESAPSRSISASCIAIPSERWIHIGRKVFTEGMEEGMDLLAAPKRRLKKFEAEAWRQ